MKYVGTYSDDETIGHVYEHNGTYWEFWDDCYDPQDEHETSRKVRIFTGSKITKTDKGVILDPLDGAVEIGSVDWDKPASELTVADMERICLEVIL